MFAGFAPLLVQWPVFSVLYLLFRSPTVGGGPNLLLSRDLLGVPLGSHWLSGAGILSVHGIVFLSVLAVLAAACWYAARVARRAVPQPALRRLRQPRRPPCRARGPDRRRQDRAVPHGADRGLRAPGGRDLPGHLHRLERGRAPGLRGQGEAGRAAAADRRREGEAADGRVT